MFTNEQIAQAVRDSLAAGYSMDQVRQGALANFGVSPEQLDSAMGGKSPVSTLTLDQVLSRMSPAEQNLYSDFQSGIYGDTTGGIPLTTIDGISYSTTPDGRLMALQRTGDTGAVQTITDGKGGVIETAELPDFNKRNLTTDLAIAAALAATGGNIAAAGFLGGSGAAAGLTAAESAASLEAALAAEQAAAGGSLLGGASAGAAAGAGGGIVSGITPAALPSVAVTGADLATTGLATGLPTAASLSNTVIPAVAGAGLGLTAGQLATGLQLANAANQLSNGGQQNGGPGGTLDPATRQMFNDNVVRANQAADALRPRQIANLDPTQSRVQELMRDNAFNNAGLNAAQQGLNRLGSFNAQAQQINPQAAQGAQVNRGDIRNLQAGSFLQGDINAYMNPYTSGVINQAMQDNERNRVLQQQQMNAQAVGRGAFGGSRQAVMEAENARNFADTQARTASNLRAQGFESAANLMQNDMNRRMQADAANQGMDANVAFQNASFLQNNNQFNAQQNNAAQAQNAANGLQAQGMNLNAAGGLLNGGLQFNNTLFNNAGQVFNAFDVNRQIQQQGFDAQRQNVFDQQQLRNSALGLNGVVQSGMQAPQSNAFGQALGFGVLGATAYNAFPNAFNSAGNTVKNWLTGGP